MRQFRILKENYLMMILFLTVSVDLFSQSGETKKLTAETNHSTIQFSVPISNGMTRITGKFNEFSIDLDLVNNDITQSRFSAIIKVNSINTGNPGRDEDLKTKDFFETDKYPEIKFTSEQVQKTENGYIVRGQFQMHGVTKTIDLPFQLTGQRGDVIGFTSRFSLKRSDYGVATEWKHTTDDKFLGDDIGVEIDFWTRKPKVKK